MSQQSPGGMPVNTSERPRKHDRIFESISSADEGAAVTRAENQVLAELRFSAAKPPESNSPQQAGGSRSTGGPASRSGSRQSQARPNQRRNPTPDAVALAVIARLLVYLTR